MRSASDNKTVANGNPQVKHNLIRTKQIKCSVDTWQWCQVWFGFDRVCQHLGHVAEHVGTYQSYGRMRDTKKANRYRLAHLMTYGQIPKHNTTTAVLQSIQLAGQVHPRFTQCSCQSVLPSQLQSTTILWLKPVVMTPMFVRNQHWAESLSFFLLWLDCNYAFWSLMEVFIQFKH